MKKVLDFNVKMQEDYYDCYDVMILTLCDYFGVDGKRSFCWRWGFNYTKQNKNRMVSFYDNMYENRNHDIVCKMMEKYLGLEVHGYFYDDINEFDGFVEAKINSGMPVGIVTDTINCTWNPLYKKQSIKHCTLIIGFDNDNYYIKEPYFSTDTIVVSKILFDNRLIKSILDISFRHVECDFREMIRESFLYVGCSSKFDSMMMYASDMRELIEIDLKDDLLKYDLRYIPSLRSFKNLGSERKGLLELFSNNSNIVPESIILLLRECVDKWQMCLVYLMRVYLTKQTNRLESISNIIKEIAETERKIHIETMNYVVGLCCEE